MFERLTESGLWLSISQKIRYSKSLIKWIESFTRHWWMNVLENNQTTTVSRKSFTGTMVSHA